MDFLDAHTPRSMTKVAYSHISKCLSFLNCIVWDCLEVQSHSFMVRVKILLSWDSKRQHKFIFILLGFYVFYSAFFCALHQNLFAELNQIVE